MSLGLLAWWLLRSDRPLSARFRFDARGGYYLDKKGLALCPRCLGDGRLIHMMDTGGALYCNACACACQKPGIPS